MARSNLSGSTILLVEDELLISMDISDALHDVGAIVHACMSVTQALASLGEMNFSAAVIDYRLGDGDAGELCQRLTDLGVPFVIYSGYREVDEVCRKWGVIPKPASPQALIARVIALLPALPGA